ncbi:MAG: hypothetical protein ACLPQY_01180 [Streptosporangiaceae bacterium]
MGQLMADLAATSGMLLTLVGVRIGLWESLAAGPIGPGELAARSSASEPYIREWLRSQAAAGYVVYEPATGRYRLPAAVAAVMAGEPLRGLVEATGLQAAAQWAEVARYGETFRTGSGIGWDEHGPAHSRGMDLISRAVDEFQRVKDRDRHQGCAGIRVGDQGLDELGPDLVDECLIVVTRSYRSVRAAM